MSAGRATGAIEAVERIINRETEADAILRQTVDAVSERLSLPLAVCFPEVDRWIVGLSAGGFAERVDGEEIRFRGEPVADLSSGRELDGVTRSALVRIAVLISPFCAAAAHRRSDSG